VVTEFVAFIDDAAQEFRVQFAVGANDEEGGVCSRLAQGVENLGCVLRVGAIVEGQGYFAFRVALASNHVGGREDSEMFGRDQVAFWMIRLRFGSNSMVRLPEWGWAVMRRISPRPS